MSGSKVWEYEGLDKIKHIAHQLLEYGDGLPVWLIEGEMGAGKTTLIKAVCEILEVEDTVSSPTYGIVNEYETLGGDVVYHFDFYRIKSEEEAEDIGVGEYFGSGAYCFVEWPSKIPNLLPDSHLKVDIKILSETKRQLVVARNEEKIGI